MYYGGTSENGLTKLTKTARSNIVNIVLLHDRDTKP